MLCSSWRIGINDSVVFLIQEYAGDSINKSLGIDEILAKLRYFQRLDDNIQVREAALG